ncbi:MAG: JAB domain-containing protein [Chitinophagaceae bacterium]
MKHKVIPSAMYEVSEIDLIYRFKHQASSRPKISGSKDAYEIFKQEWDPGKMDLCEQFKILLLNRANRVLAIFEVSSGGITGTVADPRLIFAAALKINAVSIILSHNHPSSNLKPSTADENLTKKIKQAGDCLDIKILDHIIISSEGYLSFADEGLF